MKKRNGPTRGRSRGWDSARTRCGLAADRPLRGCVGRTGFESPDHTRREIENGAAQWALKGVGFSSHALHARCRQAAARLRRSNRIRKPGPHSARNRKRGREGPIFNFWRRGQSARIARTCGPGDRGLTFSAEDGMGAARPRWRLRRRARRTGFSSSTALGEKSKTGPRGPHFQFLAERVGFEPTKGYKPLLVFKTSAFNRSATSPDCRVRSSSTSALTRAIPGARPSGALRASQSAFLPIGQPLCHLSGVASLRRALCLQDTPDSTRGR